MPKLYVPDDYTDDEKLTMQLLAHPKYRKALCELRAYERYLRRIDLIVCSLMAILLLLSLVAGISARYSN